MLTTAFACMSTNSAIAQCHAIPVWVDLKPNSVEIDVADILRKINSKTKAVILYHVAGYPGPAKKIATLCKERGVVLIEDCDNALFAYQDDQHVGSYGDFAVYSFYPNRQINAVEGGALVCKNTDMAERARRLRRFGIDFSTFRSSSGEINPKSDIPEVGWAYTMNNLSAALGYVQLPTASARIDITRANAAKIIKKLSGIREIQPIQVATTTQPVYWALLLLVENRDFVLEYMKKEGIMVSSIHQRNDVYTGFHTNLDCALPNTKFIQEHLLAVPCGWWLSEEDIEIITDTLRKATRFAALL